MFPNSNGMKTGIRPLVVGNWKMNPQSKASAVALSKQLKVGLAKMSKVEVVIAPPMLYLEGVSKVRNGSRSFALAVQNVYQEKTGPHTGEVSIPMVRDFGVEYVILGHSERRAEGETDEQVHAKLSAVLKAGLVAIVCVGERTRDESAHYLSFVEAQIRSALAGVQKAKLGNVVIAYEPIWAISSGDGHGRTMSANDVHEMSLFIEKVLSDIYGRNSAQKVRLIYGGSVNEKNAQELFSKGLMKGFLVGGASLKAESFIRIVKEVQG